MLPLSTLISQNKEICLVTFTLMILNNWCESILYETTSVSNKELKILNISSP